MSVTVTFTDTEYSLLCKVILEARNSYREHARKAENPTDYTIYTEAIQELKKLQYKLAYQPRDV